MIAASGVYMIRHRESGKCYIGSSYNMRRRVQAHRGHLNRGTHHSPHLQNAWRKHGADAFDFLPLLRCSVADLLYYEQRALSAISPPYNTATVAGSIRGLRRTPEQAARHKEAARNKSRKHEWKGRKLSLVEIAEMEGIPYSTLIGRILGLGYSIDRAVSAARRVHKYELSHDGRTQTVAQWASEIGIHPRKLHYRIAEGFTIAQIIARKESKEMSFSELCRLNGANLQTAKSRVQKGMGVMDAVTTPSRKMDNAWRNKEAA